MYEIKTEDVYEDFASDKEIFHPSNYATKSEYYDDSNKLVIRKMKVETGGVASEEFIWLKQKIYSFLKDNNEHKKAKGVNRNVVATITLNKYKNVLLNKKCLRHSINRIQSKDHKISRNLWDQQDLFSCFDDKIYIQNSGYDGRVNCKKQLLTSI